MYPNLILIGMPGCGKTTLGKMLSESLNTEFYDIDECIEKKENKSINEIFQRGEKNFRDIETNILKDICKKTGVVISTGGGVVKLQKNIDIIRNNSIVFFIDRPVENIINDVDIKSRPLLKAGRHKIYDLFKERYDLYLKNCHYRIDNSLDLKSSLDRILNILEMIK